MRENSIRAIYSNCGPFSTRGCRGFRVEVAKHQHELAPELLSHADMVSYNAKVLTVDAKFTAVEALAIRDGKILLTVSMRYFVKCKEVAHDESVGSPTGVVDRVFPESIAPIRLPFR